MDMQFCYCCRVHHPKDEMRLHATSRGQRWRCRRSIAAARGSTGERDAFGHQQTVYNQQNARLSTEYALQHQRRRPPPA